jgi:outer membrane protein OmpA-like peptidoglycan-associated protein
MNSKTVVIILFALWSVICWRWYVCGIKEACAPKVVASTQEIIKTPAIEPDTIATIDLSGDSDPVPQVSNNEPVKDKPVAPAKAKPAETKPEKPARSSFNANAYNQVQVEEVTDKMTIYFPYNNTRREDNKAIAVYLERLATRLKQSGEKVSITGHTDFVGEPAENLKFGLERAASIKNTLIKNGVPAKQIAIKSLGDTKPIATNDTPQGRYKNRRAEIKISNK